MHSLRWITILKLRIMDFFPGQNKNFNPRLTHEIILLNSMRKLISAFLFLPVYLSAGPSDTLNTRFSAIQFGLGLENRLNPLLTLQDFKQQLPQSNILAKYVGLLEDYGSYATSNPIFTAKVNYRLAKHPKPRQVRSFLRVGFQFTGFSSIIATGYQSQNLGTDTLVSAVSGNYLFVDSTQSQTLQVDLQSQQLRLDLAYIFETGANKRFSFVSGVGVLAGISLQSQFEIYFNTFQSYQAWNNPNNKQNLFIYESNTSDADRETFSAPNVYHAQFYIPLGLRLQLGRKIEGLYNRKSALLFEFRPSIMYESAGRQLKSTFSGFQFQASWSRQL